MPETLSNSLIAAKNDLHSISPLVWLFEIDLDGTDAARLAGYQAAVVFEGNTYSPFHIVVSGLDSDAEGNLEQPRVTASNVGGSLVPYLEAGDVVDRTVRILTVLSTDLAAYREWGTFVVLDATVDQRSITLALGVAALFDAPFPAKRISRGRCGALYGGAECGYPTALPNLIAATRPSFDPTTCDLTLEGGNGCRAHGENEAANGAAVLHPLRFEGHPSLPRGPARV